MNADFILVATGDVTMTAINHAIFGTLDGAQMEAERVIPALHKGGYHRFNLFDVRRIDGSADKLVASFRVTEQTPLVNKI